MGQRRPIEHKRPGRRRGIHRSESMHLTTNALVLREANYKESDKILTLLTEK